MVIGHRKAGMVWAFAISLMARRVRRQRRHLNNWRSVMDRKNLKYAVRFLSLLVLVAGASAFGQVPAPVHFSGLINDYTPSTVKGGPWEMHGEWTLDVNRRLNTADFSAELTMSDYGVTSTGAIDPTQPGQGGHTHHIKISGAKITWNMTGCPVYSPATKQGFQFQKTVSLITANGSNAPFETTTPPVSMLTVCVTGGDAVPYSVPFSNITLQFGAPANTHFGSQAIHGVVVKAGFQSLDILR
jgi:hypothetical protein